MKEIDDMPLEVVVNQYLYKLNADIKKLVEIRVEELLAMLGDVLGQSNSIEKDMEKIMSHLEIRSNTWEELGEVYRYKKGNGCLMTIVEEFVQNSSSSKTSKIGKEEKSLNSSPYSKEPIKEIKRKVTPSVPVRVESVEISEFLGENKSTVKKVIEAKDCPRGSTETENDKTRQIKYPTSEARSVYKVDSSTVSPVKPLILVQEEEDIQLPFNPKNNKSYSSPHKQSVLKARGIINHSNEYYKASENLKKEIHKLDRYKVDYYGPKRVNNEEKGKFDDLFEIKNLTCEDFQGGSLSICQHSKERFIMSAAGGHVYELLDTDSGTLINSEIKKLSCDIEDIDTDKAGNVILQDAWGSLRVLQMHNNTEKTITKFEKSNTQNSEKFKKFVFSKGKSNLIVNTSNDTISSFSSPQYLPNKYCNLKIPKESGQIIDLLPGNQSDSKIFLLTKEGDFIRIGQDDSISHIYFAKRRKTIISNPILGGEKFTKMAISKNEDLVAIIGSLKLPNGTYSNQIYLFNIHQVKDKFELALMDTIEIMLNSNSGRNEDFISDLEFSETKNRAFLIAISSESATLRLFGIKKDDIQEITDEYSLKEQHSKGGCKMIKGREGQFYVISKTGGVLTNLSLTI